MADAHEVIYTDAVIEQASASFVHRFFTTTHGRLLMVASAINLMGFALVAVLVRDQWLMLFIVGLIAALGPVYLAAIYFLFPKRFSAVLKQRLQPCTRVTVTSSGFGLSARGRSVELPWSDLKAILEFPEYFLLVMSRISFTVIPKADLSIASQHLIRNASKSLER